MTLSLFRTAPDSLACQQRASADVGMRWFPWINLVWSVWLFITPFYAADLYRGWLWPTLSSYAVFLFLFQRFHYDHPRHRLAIALAIGALGFALLPYNPGSQSYIIYACAFFPFCMSARKALLTICALLALYSVAWLAVDIPMIYMPMALLSGLWLPLRMLPEMVEKIAPLWPAWHLSQLGLKIVGQDSGRPVWMHVTVMLGFTAICLFLAQRRLQRA